MAQQIDIVANLLMKVDGAEAGINKLKSSLSKLKMPEGLENSFKKSFSNLDTIFAKYRNQVEKGFNTKGDVSAFSKTSKELDAELNRISRHFTELTGKQIDFKVKSDSIVKAEKDLQNLITQKEKLGKDTLQFKIDSGKSKSDIESLLKTFKEIAGVSTNAGKAANNVLGGLGRGDITSTLNAAKQLEQAYQRLGSKKKDLFSSTTGLDMGTVVTALITQLTGVENKFKVVDGEIKIATQDLARFKADQIGDAASQVEKLSNSFEQNKSAISQVNGVMQDYARSSQSMSQQLGDLQQSTQYFFSLRNMINLFKRGIDDAIQSVKELDAAMTETAVVTDYKVSDMWNMLPQYTQLANQLGATTQGAYETMTLYFQQGLDQQQAFELGAETMKMARIAGLDYAETTDMMTAALRGFNMELNETSAKRVNDVYSELAAITASDTEELGTAMQRTASIAHSAGASFEGTTAFLAQAIETTREPAENIGTAMKTIIARFQEMKKNPLEISEVDGEEVDYNKIDAALKTIGVDLKDTNGQFRDFDKVMLDISSRWDTLSQSQQRYIATVAAGSRQQSRFIAMVSDYDRTMELMEAANNSAGASNEQFDKTMDSLESKLNKLHNAWQAFTMGIANNGMIKFAVDGITSLLTGVNSLIDTLSGGIGPIKSFLSLFTAFTGLKASGKIMNSIIGGLGGLIDPTSTFSIGFGRGMTGNKFAGNAAFAAQINQPIVAGLREVVNAINKDTAIQQQQNARFADNSNAYAQRDAFKNASAALRDYSFKNPKIFTINELRKQLSGLTGQNQNLLMRSNASTFNAATNALLLKYAGKDSQKYNALKAGERNLNDARKAGQLTAEQYYQHLQDPGLLKDALLRSGIKQDNPAYQYLNELNNQVTARATEITKQETEAMREQFEAYQNSGEYNHLTEADLQKRIQDEILSEKGQSRIRGQALKEKGLDPEFKNTPGGKILQSIGRLGAGISQAGMGIQAFGSILMSSANPALQTFGAALTSIGGLIGNLGMAVSGLSSGFSAIAGSKFMTSLAGSGTVLGGFMTTAGAVTGGLMLLVGAIAGAAVLIKKHNEKIKEDAEKVTTDYKEKSEQHQSNISNLTSYREDFARLSAGVDANGMNVNLDTADYERYLEITKAIASINPGIVDGYNAQGNAIISNRNALEETLAIEKERQSIDFNNYTDSTSTEKLIAARNLSRQSKDKETFTRTWDPRGTMSKNVPVLGYEFAPQAEMRKQAQNVGKNLQAGIKEGWAKEDILKDFNISADDLTKGNEDAIRAFEQNYDKIKARISNTMDSAGDELKDKTKESMLDAFSGYNEASDELDELITPLYEQQLARIGKNLELPSEFKSSFNQGLKEIVSDANITDVEGEVDDLAAAFSNLASEDSQYSQILKDVTNAQDKYAESLNKTEYDAAAKDAKERIEALKASLSEDMDLTQGYGKAVSDFLDNEIHKIENFTKDGAANLQHALNTMTDQIAAAEGALENFNSIAEGSTYGKAASNMSQIYETATADEHTLGEGDQVLWAGAEALVGRKNLLEGGDLTKDKALAQMKEVQEMLKGGQEGWDNFKTKWFENADANFKVLEDGSRRLLDKNGEIIKGLTLDDNNWFSEINEDMNPEVYDQIADALDMSKESLIAMLNLGRQFGEVDFTNISEVRKALATSDTTIKNADNGKIFVKQDTLESEMTSAGIALNKQQEIEQDLQDNYNTELIKSANEITKANNQFAEMGITSMESLVKTFDDTGQFTKDEIRGYAEKWAEFNGQQGELAKFDEYWKNNQQDKEYGGIPSSLNSIESILSNIASILASQRLEEGYLDNSTAQASRDWLLGGKGQDTEAQYFWKGQGTNGEAISTSNFQKTSSDLTDFINKSKEYVNQLSKTDPANNTEREQINKEIADYKNLIDRAETYLAEGTEAYNSNLQQQIDAINQDKEVINNGFADLFGSITPDSINTDGAQQALGQLYEAAINNAPIELDSSAASQNLVNQLQNWGITLEDAIAAGLVTDTNGIYTKGQKTGEEAGKAATDGVESGVSGADTSQGKGEAEKKAKSAVEGVGEEIASGASEANIDNQQDTVAQKVGSAIEQAMSGITQAANNARIPAQPQSNAPQQSNQELLVAYTVKITNTGEMLASVNQQIDQVLQSAAAKTHTVTASGSIKVNYSKGTQAKASNQNATVNYLKGTQVKPEAMSAPVNYTLGSQASPSSKSASVNYSIGYQESPDNKTAYVTYKKSPWSEATGGLVTHAGPMYLARGGLASNPMFKRQGTDTIPTMLTPGEYVQNRKAVRYFGIDFMRKINHKDLIGALQSFGSVAKGRYGRLGPNGKGGLTLTGEEGFEVGWIPSENRSVILGTNGPQMVDLPSDTIIWDHKQSKKIINQNVIPAGSHYTRSKGATRPGSTTTTGNRNRSGDGGGGGGSQDSNTIQQNAGNAEEAKKVIQKAGWVTVWWENMTRRIDATQKKIDNSASKFDKQIKTFGTTVTSIQGTVKDYRKNLNLMVALNKNEVTQANYELKQLTNPKAWYNRKEVSYEVTKKEDGKEQKETKKMNILLSNFVHYNKTYGSWEISQKAIDLVGLGGKDSKGRKVVGNQSLAEAIKQVAEKEVNERNSKLKTAENNIKKAQEALEKLSNDIYETFYRWEKSINKVYLLSQKLEILNEQLAVSSAKSELQFSKLAAGATNAAGVMSKITTALNTQRTTLLNKANATKERLGATKSQFLTSLTITPYASNYLKNPDSTNARNDFIAARKAFEFLNQANLSGNNFDYTKALNYLNQAGMSKDEYDAIKGVLDKIFEKQNNYLQAQEESYKSIDEIYQTMSEYESFIADFETDLLSGIEEQAESQVNHLEKLNSALSKAFKDLIDEVKNKLDERRKKEDNQKTESELSQKQQRLSMLRADTSGGHAVEIAQLEKEIAEGQQNYQRSLEDQLIEKLQQQGDAAEKQRQQQIDLLTIQNEVAKETGTNLAQVKEWLKDPKANYENIRAAWLANQNYDEVPEGTREKLEHDFEEAFAKYQGYGVQIEKYDQMIDELLALEKSVDKIATNVSLDRPTYTASDMKAKGYSAASLKKLGYSAASLLNAGYTAKNLKSAGFNATQIANGFKTNIKNKKGTTKDAIAAMHTAGFSNEEIAKQFGAQATMQNLNASGKSVQSALGKDKNATAKYLQTKIVNAGGKNISQSDMNGVQVNISADKKTILAAIKGNWAYGHSGSNLYAQKWDKKSGKLVGKPAKYSIQGLTPAVLKAAGWEGKAALEYAIKNSLPGTLINKNFLALAKEAGIIGKEYQINTGKYKVMATVGGDGNIFYNVANGVQVWNPAKKGVNWLDKYNLARFKKMAKSTAGREYAQVLRAKGVKGYATGGLANYTGPAWLDGTPSKPELVLNAQDTKNFIALKDVLSKAMSSTDSVSNEYGGNATYEININVDHLNNDYDVDKVVERVKKKIVQDSGYRNVTQVRKFR